MMFTYRMAEELAAYFAGAHVADMGLRSNMGAQLDMLASQAQSSLRAAPEWNGHSAPPDQVITCRPSHSGASEESTEASTAALAAVRAERRIRAALSLLCRAEAVALRSYYTPRPASSPSGCESLGEWRGVIADKFGSDAVRGIIARATSKPTTPDEKRDKGAAKAELAALKQQAKMMVGRAQEAYAVAWDETGRLERMERARRFAGV